MDWRALWIGEPHGLTEPHGLESLIDWGASWNGEPHGKGNQNIMRGRVLWKLKFRGNGNIVEGKVSWRLSLMEKNFKEGIVLMEGKPYGSGSFGEGILHGKGVSWKRERHEIGNFVEENPHGKRALRRAKSPGRENVLEVNFMVNEASGNRTSWRGSLNQWGRFEGLEKENFGYFVFQSPPELTE